MKIILVTLVMLLSFASPAFAGPGVEFDACLGFDTQEEPGGGGVELCLVHFEARLPG